MHGIILAISENAKKRRKKTGNLFLISCLGVPFYVAAIIQFFGMAVHRAELYTEFFADFLGHVAAIIQFFGMAVHQNGT